MTPKRPLITMLTVLLLGVFIVSADNTEEYQAFVDETREAVYSMDLPAFAVRDIPERYKDESAVYVAVYNDIDARKKTGFGRLPGTLRFSRKARVEGGELRRVLILVNDRAALEKFSEFDFSTDMKKKMSNAHRRQRHAMGVRVIKPDGRIVDVGAEDFVDVEDGKNGKEKRRKLAVPGLEIGDMLDVFFYTEHKLQNVHLEPFTFFLRDEYPIMDYQIHAVVDDKLTTQYRTLHGAPDFAISRDEDENYVLDMDVKDVPAEPRLWYRDAEQSPMIKMSVFNRRSDAYTPWSARKDGLQSNPAVKDIKDDYWSGRASIFYSLKPFLGAKLKNTDKAVKSVKKLFKEGKLDTVQVTDYLYNLLTLAYFVSDDALYPMLFDVQLNGLAGSVAKGLITTVITADRDEEPVDSLISMFNATGGTMAGNHRRHYFPPRALLAPSEIHPDFIGRRAQKYKTADYRKKHPEWDSVYFEIPMTTVADNRNVTDLQVSFDGMKLDVRRRESYLGSTKLNLQRLLTEEEIIDAYLEYLNRYGASVSLKKKAVDRSERYATSRLERIDGFKDEIKSYHGDSPAEYVDGRIVSVGIDPESPEMVYELDCKLDGLVKRAGGNLVLSVGKLLSGQTEVVESDRRRTDDALMISPREFVTNIRIDVPEGYRLSEKSLAALARNVVNEVGEFSVRASQDDGDLTISVVKRYNNRRIPVKDWIEALKMLDAAAAWQSQTIVLEKI